jgi:hypothetical protein
MGKSLRRYLVVLLLLAGVLTLGRDGWIEAEKIGCMPAGGTQPPGGWLNYCASDRIGDYDHAAVWFGTEPGVGAAIRNARVLLFGDSKMQGAASQPTVEQWFAERSIPFYLLAFTSGEQSGWAERLIAKFHPHPAVMVFDTDPYFTGGLSLPAQAIIDDPAGEKRAAEATHAFIAAGPTYCTYLGWLCGRTESSYRSFTNGRVYRSDAARWWFGIHPGGRFPVTPPPPPDLTNFPSYLQHARAVLDEAQIPPRCMVFTLVPNSDDGDTLAHYLAEQLGARVISPHLDGMATGDGMHLTYDSAQRWMAALLTELEPVIRECSGVEEQSKAATPSHG